jgi:hypothetical protein
MSDPNELERIGNLFDVATNVSETFLEECSKTKFLAVNDYYKAEDEYIKLAEKILCEKKLGIVANDDCIGRLSNVKSELESGQLDSRLIDALESLRVAYLESVLRPAVMDYIHNDRINDRGLKKVYTNALKIENLLEVIQFMNKVQTIE